MQQLKLHNDSSNNNKNKISNILCENCLTLDKKTLKVCIYCLQFVCHTCSQNHKKHNHDTPLFQSKTKWIEIITVQNQEVFKNKMPSIQLFQSFRDPMFTLKWNCHRCQAKIANKVCLDCSSKAFCFGCFNQLHSTQKFKTHKTTQFQKNESKITEQTTIEVKKQQRIKPQTQRCITQNVKLKTKRDGQNNQIEKKIINQNDTLQQIGKNLINLSLMSSTLSQNAHRLQKNYEYLFLNIKKILEQQIEELKLKLLEIQLIIKSKKEKLGSQSIQILDQIKNIETNYQNIEIVLQNRLIEESAKISSKKLQSIRKRHQLIKQKYQEILNQDLETKISQQFNIDMLFLKEKISKIQYKRIVYKQEIKNSLLLTSSPKSEKKLSHQSKPMKKSMNLVSCKSQTRLKPLAMSQINSQFNSKARKANKNQNKLLETSPIFLKSYSSSPSDSNLNPPLFSVQPFKQPKKPDLLIKQMRTKVNLQKSARYSHKAPFFDNKTGINKAMLNIQTTKKMIDQMRSQISEFPCYKLIDNQSLFGITDRQDVYSNVQVQQKLNISINSSLFEQETAI